MEYKKVPFSPRTPEGFRLATSVEERAKFSELSRLQIIDDSEVLRLLDGVFCNGKEISVSGDSWPRMDMLVVSESPTIISRDSSLLRRELYSEVNNLGVERREVALRLSCLFKDIEVLYWLLRDWETKGQFEEYLKQNEGKAYFTDFLKILKILFTSVPIREGEVTGSLDYVVKDDGVVPDNALAIAEILLDECRKERSLDVAAILDSQLQILANMRVDTNDAEAKRIAEAKRVGILTKLLSDCSDPLQHKDDIIQSNFINLLTEATRRGYDRLTYALWRLECAKYELEKYDVHGRGENLLHYAAKREYGEKIVNLLAQKCEKLIYSWNEAGQTPLHVAAMCGNGKLVKKVKEFLHSASEDPLKVKDFAGQTPLHLAARRGDEETVRVLLDCGSDPFERDMRGKTALHHAVTNESKETGKRTVEVLLNHLKINEKKALLLWISAAGIGTADEVKGLDPDLKKFLKQQKHKTSESVNVVNEAAKSGDLRLTWEFLNRGGNLFSIDDRDAFRITTNAIENFCEHVTDRPAYWDTLGRKVLAECISAHFLKPYIKSPITVCISGGSGSGKSSLLYQIEACLLITAAQLAFPDLWNEEKFNGLISRKKTSKGKEMRRNIENGVNKLLESSNNRDFQDHIMPLPSHERPGISLKYLLKKYLQKHKAVYKYLACMDFNQFLRYKNMKQKTMKDKPVHENDGQSLGAVPRILTVNFNAGKYRGRAEAWAGLAIEITKEIETSMTWAQLSSTRLRNAWSRHSHDFYFRFIFPSVLSVSVGACIGWAAWKLIDSAGPSESKELKYGSVFATVVAILWSVLQQLFSVFKSVSTQMSGYFSSPDYSQHLGYQQKVIDDIQFLKKEIGKKPCFFFSFIAGDICKNWWGFWKENVRDTCVPRYGSAPEGKLRIIAFVDDLDHCEETVILPMLSAIDLVFRECEINVVLAMDKASIQAAYRTSRFVQERDFVDKLISKLVQLPVDIPDPTDEEWAEFLNLELVDKKDHNKKHQSEEHLSNAPSEVSAANGEELEEVGAPKDIESGGRAIKFEGLCITLWIRWLRSWLKGILSFFRHFILPLLYVVCNIRDEIPRNQPDSNYGEEPEFVNDCKKTLSKRMRKLRDTLMLSYTDEEVQTFNKLKRYATGIQKLPREWKCCISYYMFARNVVSRMEQVSEKSYPAGWQVEFAVWTFVCSQWKHEINVLIENWYKYADANDVYGRAKLKSSLKKIVADYIAQRNWKEQTGCTLKFTVEEQTGWQVGEQGGKQVFIVSNPTQSSPVGRVEKERERWKNLLKCLENVHDVSLDGLRCFQHYRFHCNARNLVSKLFKHPKELSSNNPFLSTL